MPFTFVAPADITLLNLCKVIDNTFLISIILFIARQHTAADARIDIVILSVRPSVRPP